MAPPETHYDWGHAYLTDGEHRWRIASANESRSSSTGLFGRTTHDPVKAELVFALPQTVAVKTLVVPPSLQLRFDMAASSR